MDQGAAEVASRAVQTTPVSCCNPGCSASSRPPEHD